MSTTPILYHKECLFELIAISFVSIVSGLCSFGLIIFLYKSFGNRVTSLLVLMIIVLSIFDVFISFSAAFYRITLIFLDPLSIDDNPTSQLFTFGAWVWGFGLRVSILVPFFFCISLYLEIEFGLKREGNKVKCIYFLLIFAIALGWSLIPLLFNGYGLNEDAMLTIVNRQLMFFLFYFPLTMVILTIIGLVVRSVVLIRRTSFADQMVPFIYFPLVLIACYLFGIIRRLLNVFGEDEEWLRFLMNILMAMQGTLNTLYCIFMTRKTTNLCVTVFACLNNHEEEPEDPIEEEDKRGYSSEEEGNSGSLIKDYEMPRVGDSPDSKL